MNILLYHVCSESQNLVHSMTEVIFIKFSSKLLVFCLHNMPINIFECSTLSRMKYIAPLEFYFQLVFASFQILQSSSTREICTGHLDFEIIRNVSLGIGKSIQRAMALAGSIFVQLYQSADNSRHHQRMVHSG